MNTIVPVEKGCVKGNFYSVENKKLTVMTKKVFRAIPNGPKTDPIIPIEGNWWDVE